MLGSRPGGGYDDDNDEEDNDKNDDNDKDGKGVSALGLDRDLGFAERSEQNPCRAASFAKPR